MPNEKENILPPYLAFKTFRSAIQDLRVHGLPQTLDRTAWGTKSGTDQSQIMNSLKFMGLIDEKGTTLATLGELVGLGEDSPEERAYFGGLIRNAYADVFMLDLKSATPKQLEDAIGSYGITGILRDRAVRFFLKAAGHCSVPLSTRLTKNLRERSPEETPQGAVEGTSETPKKTNGKPRKGRKSNATSQQVPPPAMPSNQTSNAMKSIQLPNVGGSLTISGTFNAFMLVGEERDLLFQIIDLMTDYEKKQFPKSSPAQENPA